MRTPLNQMGQAVQVHVFSDSASTDNIAIDDVTAAVVNVNEATGKIIQVCANIDFMLRIAKSDTPAVTEETAHMFLTAGIPYYIKVPGADTVVTADQWHVHVLGSVAAIAGRLSVMEIQSY